MTGDSPPPARCGHLADTWRSPSDALCPLTRKTLEGLDKHKEGPGTRGFTVAGASCPAGSRFDR